MNSSRRRPEDLQIIRELEQTIRDLRELRQEIEAAQEDQWTRPQGKANPVEDTRIRSKGDHPNDPTGNVAVDEGRLRLRRQMRTTRRDVHAISRAAFLMVCQLRAARRPYSGE